MSASRRIGCPALCPCAFCRDRVGIFTSCAVSDLLKVPTPSQKARQGCPPGRPNVHQSPSLEKSGNAPSVPCFSKIDNRYELFFGKNGGAFRPVPGSPCTRRIFMRPCDGLKHPRWCDDCPGSEAFDPVAWSRWRRPQRPANRGLLDRADNSGLRMAPASRATRTRSSARRRSLADVPRPNLFQHRRRQHC